MPTPTRNFPPRQILYLLILFSGFAALSWEVIWQIKSTLALGVSAWGAAITLAVTMAGMGVGGWLMGRALRDGSVVRPFRIYSALEFVIGISGLLLNAAFLTLGKLDTWFYNTLPGSAPPFYMLGITTVIGIPAVCMGATIPVFGLIADHFQISIAKLYSLNTIGAAVGVLFVALILISSVGITHSIWVIAAVNITVAFCAWLYVPANNHHPLEDNHTSQPISCNEMLIVFITGFATFTLEIAWFRSFAASFPNTTNFFATLLACMLVALALASRKIPLLKLKKKSLAMQLCLAGILILLITPLIERFDMALYPSAKQIGSAANFAWLLNPDTFTVNGLAIFLYALQILVIFTLISFLIVPPMYFLGIAFPWILDNHHSSGGRGKLYAINTFASMLGAIGAAWFLLPIIGFAKASWIAGALVVLAGILITPGGLKRVMWMVLGTMALLTAMHFETGIGKTRMQGFFANLEGKPARVLESYEGPEATVSAVEYEDGGRALLINSASAAGEAKYKYKANTHYLAWMGHLPMLAQPKPRKVLVIGFGTGQTANAARKENPDSVDVVEVNPRVFQLAHNFISNEHVLNDPKVKSIVMDGRAYLRRSKKVYDVITLEPMPPTTAGVNALYSREFYELASARLGPKGVIAQWLPFQAIAPHYAASIAKTFIDVFPNAVLWIDPVSKVGILLGTKDHVIALGIFWPGFARTNLERNLTREEVQKNIALDARELQQYAAYGEIITDDNQLLAYGKALYVNLGLQDENFTLLRRINHTLIYLSY